MDSNVPYNQEKTRISFDFDGTLGHKRHIQALAQEMCRDPHNEVHIITRRYGYVHDEHGDEMSQVIQVAEILNIPRERVHFLNRQYKLEKIKELGMHIHWDDDLTEIALIRKDFPECRGFLVL